MARNTFAFVGILAVLLMSLGMVSAGVVSIENIADNESNINHNDGSFQITFDLKNEGATGTLNWSNTVITSGDATITFSQNEITADTTDKITAIFNFDAYQSGKIAGLIDVIRSSTSTHINFTFSITINPTPKLTITPTDDILSKTKNGTIKVQNTGNVNLENIELKQTPADFTVQFNETDFNLNAGDSKLIEVSSTDAKDLDFRDDNSINIWATSGTLNSDPITLTINNLFYDGDNDGDLEVSIDKISVEEGFGDDEEYWYPFDEIELDIEVENNGDWDIEDIELRICLLDVERGSCILDEDDMDIEDNDFDLDTGDDKSITVTFDVDPNDLKEGNTNYILYVSAVGEIDDNKAGDDDGKETGHSTSEEIEIRTDEEFIIIDQIVLTDLSKFLNENEASCNSEVMITAKVWNIGDKDIDDDEIFVRIYNKALGINKVISFDRGIDSMDWELLETTITIPADAQEKTYSIQFTAYDDANFADKYIYENREDDRAEYGEFLKITDCKDLTLIPTITASLESAAEIGTELIVKATITNNGEDNDFIISASDFDAWATMVSIVPQTVSIAEGESAEIIITFNPTTTGSHSFKINTIVGGESYDQSVSVSIKEKPGIFAGLNNTTLYIIVGILAVLILIILTVIVKASRRKVKPEF